MKAKKLLLIATVVYSLLTVAAETASCGGRWDGGRMLVEEGDSKELKVEDNIAWLEAGKVPDYAVGNVIRWLELRHVDCARFRERYRPQEPDLGKPLSERKGFRLGFMLDISRDRVPTMATLRALVDALEAFGYNELQLYNEVSFAYAGHREMWEGWSPMSAEEIRELDDYCWKRGIVLTPNQNSFGHLEKLFRHRRYLPLAEAPDGFTIEHPPLKDRWPCALCATDPKSLDFLGGLYDEYLPLFAHADRLHVGCDEVWDIFAPNARSAAKAAKFGVPRVYTDFLLQVGDLCRDRRHRMMFWADMVLYNSEQLDKVPKDSLPVNWGYGGEEKGDPGYTAEFEGRCIALKRRGLDFYVAPSDNVYGSCFGRFRRAKSNVDLVVTAARRYGACGLLLTCWGDGGHRAPWFTSLPALAYTAAKVRGENPTDEQVAAAVDSVLGCRIGAALVALGSVADPERRTVTEEKPDRAFADAVRDAWSLADVTGAAPLVRSGCEMLQVGVDVVRARADGAYDARQREFARRFVRAWLGDSRPGGLRESLVRELKLPVPEDLDALADDATFGPVLRVPARGVDLTDRTFLSRHSAVVIDGSLGLETAAMLSAADALVDYVRKGGGLALIRPDFPAFRGADQFLQMVAGSTRGTPWSAKGTWRFVNERPLHPVNAAFRGEPVSFARSVEVPMLTSFYERHRCDVLVSMDLSDEATRRAERDWFVAKGSGESRRDGDYAVSWVRREGKGRVFCTAFGPTDPALARHVADGVRFARGALSEPAPDERVAWRPECRLDWANGIWHEGLAEKARAAQGKAFDLVAFGDSITEFWGSSKDSPQKGGKEVWERNFGAFGDRSQAFGMAGDRTENLLWRVTEGGQADGWTAKAIFVLVGINNRMCRRTPDARPDTPEETARGVQVVVRALRLRHPESKVVVFGVLPTAFKGDEAWVRDCNRTLAGLAWGDRVVYRDIGDRFVTADGAFDKTLFRDGVHPNSLGYERFANALRDEMQEMSGF